MLRRLTKNTMNIYNHENDYIAITTTSPTQLKKRADKNANPIQLSSFVPIRAPLPIRSDRRSGLAALPRSVISH